MKMNPKFMKRKIILRNPNNSIQNTPHLLSGHTTGSTLKSSSIKDVIRKPISTEEYNKILIKNQRLAKDNAFLKYQSANDKESLRLARNESIELKQKLSAANTLNERLKKQLNNKTTPEISGQIKAAVSLLMEDYLAIDAIKQEINRLGARSQSVRGIMSSLQTLIDSNNQSNESQNSDQNCEQIDSFRSINSSVRYSLSSQERDLKRRLSVERIRRDFHILSEMSTIFEMSTEHRMSSLASDERNNGSNNINEMVNNIHKDTTFNTNVVLTDNFGNESTNVSNVNTSKTIVHKELALNQNNLSTSSHSLSSATASSIGNQKNLLKEVKTTNTKRKTKKETNTESKTQKKPKPETKTKKKNEKSLKTQIKSGTKDDSIVYDFTEDEENKENIVPSKLAIRFSTRVRNKRFPLV